MRDVLQYFDLITKIIELIPTVSVELDFEQLDQKRGILEGTIYFADGSRLEFTERIVIERARPIKREYRYQYVRAQAAVFRYDNAPHHPHLPGFPHHKHVGRRTIATSEPTLKEVLQEVTALLPTETDASTATPPRRSGQRPKKR
jgi:hypothetical protein